jgi:hypothetical protein
MIVAARTLERSLFVTRSHLGFVRRHFDQVHLGAASRTFHVGRPFTFNTNGRSLTLRVAPAATPAMLHNAAAGVVPNVHAEGKVRLGFHGQAPTRLALARHYL